MPVLASTNCYTPYNNKTLALVRPATRTTPGQSRLISPYSYKCVMSLEVQVSEKRRSANYHPAIWEPELIESLSTPYSYDLHATRLAELKDDVRNFLVSMDDNPCDQLKLIDSMQRLGVAYHFEDLIKKVLSLVEIGIDWDLDTASLHFRLLRQNGINVSSDVFDKFRDEKGKFKDNLTKDLGGIISLYEASHLGLEGEDPLEGAKNFSRELLKSQLRILQDNTDNDHLVEKIQQLLEIPVHWRMPRLEARNFFDLYQPSSYSSLVLLELAKLDYNLLQALYQKELKESIRWWRNLNFKERLPFTRDRLMENYLWSMGMVFEPQFSKCRIGLTKFVCILSAIDDIYDVYASLEEVELFTKAVNRWDCNDIKYLPEYMQVCFLAMFNFGNELVYDIMKDQGVNVLPHIKKAWAILCGSYLTEARWFARGYTPTFSEYLENAWTSVGGPSAIIHAYALHGQSIPDTTFDCLDNGSQLLYWSSLITRLSDDLGTSADENIRGDVTKAIRCYMNEEDASEEEAKEHIKTLISYSWKKINEESAKSFLPKSFVKMCLNMARTAQCIYQHGDGIGTSNGITKDRLTKLVVDPILN